MSTESAPLFTYEVAEAGNAETGYITTIACHGRVVTQTAGELKDLVKPLISRGGRIVLDFSDITGVDSQGAGHFGRAENIGSWSGLLHVRVHQLVAPCAGAFAHYQADSFVFLRTARIREDETERENCKPGCSDSLSHVS